MDVAPMDAVSVGGHHDGVIKSAAPVPGENESAVAPMDAAPTASTGNRLFFFPRSVWVLGPSRVTALWFFAGRCLSGASHWMLVPVRPGGPGA